MVKQIKYKEKDHPVRIGYTTLCKVKEVHGKGFSEMGADDIEMFHTLLYYGLVSGAKAEGKECTMSKEDATEYLEDNMFEFGEMVTSFFPTKEEAGNEETDLQGKK